MEIESSRQTWIRLTDRYKLYKKRIPLFPEFLLNTAHMIRRSHLCSLTNITWSKAETGDHVADEARMMSAGVLSVNISPITGLCDHEPHTRHRQGRSWQQARRGFYKALPYSEKINERLTTLHVLQLWYLTLTSHKDHHDPIKFYLKYMASSLLNI